jgi:hypothetical protein
MPPKNTPQIENKERPAGEKAKKLLVAALALLVLAMPILAQTTTTTAANATGGGGGGGGVGKGRDIVLESGAVKSVQSAAGALMAIWGIVWWASLIIFGIYYFVMSKLAPATWARWSYINDLIDKYKWLLLTIILSPFAVGLVMLGIDMAATQWNANVPQELKPENVIVNFLNKVLFDSIVKAAQKLNFW